VSVSGVEAPGRDVLALTTRASASGMLRSEEASATRSAPPSHWSFCSFLSPTCSRRRTCSRGSTVHGSAAQVTSADQSLVQPLNRRPPRRRQKLPKQSPRSRFHRRVAIREVHLAADRGLPEAVRTTRPRHLAASSGDLIARIAPHSFPLDGQLDFRQCNYARRQEGDPALAPPHLLYSDRRERHRCQTTPDSRG
jgi:hypothetical protein